MIQATRDNLTVHQKVQVTDCKDYPFRNGFIGTVACIYSEDVSDPVKRQWPVNVNLEFRRGSSYFSFDELSIIQ